MSGSDDLRARPFDSVGFLLSQLGTSNAKRFHEVIAPTGLEPRHYAVLRHVSNAEGESQQAIASALGVPASRVVVLIDELEERSLIERRTDPADRRVRALHLTEKGREVLSEASELAFAHEAAVCSSLEPRERETLIGLLKKVARSQGLRPGVHPEIETGERPFEP